MIKKNTKAYRILVKQKRWRKRDHKWACSTCVQL